MKTYTIVIHEAVGCGAGFWAEVEELPGCYAFSDNLGRLAQDVQHAIESHVSKLKQAGRPIPEGRYKPSQESQRWQIAVPA